MFIHLPAGVFQRVMAVISIPLCLAVVLWAALGRVLFGVQGTLTLILGLTLGPTLFVLLALAAVKITVNAARYRPIAASMRASLVLLAVAVAGFGFGFTMPDVGERGGSVMSHLTGGGTEGVALQVSWGICNALGIILMGLSITLLVLSIRDAKQTDRIIADHLASTGQQRNTVPHE